VSIGWSEYANKKKLEHNIINRGIKKFFFEINDLSKKNIISPTTIMIIEKILFNSKKKWIIREIIPIKMYPTRILKKISIFDWSKIFLDKTEP